MNSSTYYTREDCRLCGSRQLTKVLELVPTPPANAFVESRDLDQEQQVYPLDLHFCEACTHVQLLTVVNPEELFRNYVYVSGTSPAFVKHFADYADSVLAKYDFEPSACQVVEIGSNDGTLLRQFQRHGCPVLGVDPAVQIAEEATENGLLTLANFFSFDLAAEIKSQYGPARIVCANNVFAHADDLHDILKGVRSLLANDGVFVFEVSYLLDVFEGTLFDTIYHEHLSYHSVRPLENFFAAAGLELIDVERVPTHGGSLRGTVQVSGGPYKKASSVDELISAEAEAGLHLPGTFVHFGDNIRNIKRELTDTLASLKAEGATIAGYGAPAKATTLMYHFGIDGGVIDFIVDDSEYKQNLFSPGLHIPVKSSAVMDQQVPDYFVILAWNFADPIMAKLESFKSSGGKFIVPLPEIRII